MRITGGQSKGRLLVPLKGMNIRPTSDKIKEAIFNILGQELRGMKVLDLFSGSGSLGIEALSRGALWSVFVDNSNQAINQIKKNLVLCGYSTSGVILKKNLKWEFPKGHSLIKKGVDLIFMDPPYRKALIPPVLENISNSNIMTPSSKIIVESSKDEKLPVTLKNAALSDTRIYGETKISIYQYEELDE